MKRFPETDDEKIAHDLMFSCLLRGLMEARNSNLDKAQSENKVLAAAGNMIANAPENERGLLMLAFWQCLSTTVTCGQDMAAARSS